MNWLNYPAGRTADRRNLIWFVSLFAACLLKSIVTSESITSTFNETGSILSPTTSVLTSDDNHGLSTPFSSSFESLSNQTHFWFNDFRSEDHQNGYCVLGGICGFGGGVSDDAIIPCHVPHRPRKLRNEKLQMLRDFCPSLFDQDPHRDSFCCSEEQIDDMVENTRLAGSIGMENCPSCFQNFKQLFCQMSCSPHQSKLLQVVGQQKLDANFELEAKSSLNGFELLSTHGAEFTLQQTNEINLFVNRTLAQGVYDSCKSVRSMLGSSHSILRLMCDKEDCLVQDWLDFVGRHHKEDGRSPYRINFLITSGRQHESLYDLVQNESLAKHAVDSILVKPNWSNASQVLPINYHFYRCDQAISAKLGQCGCDNCEQTCAAILQDLRLLTHLSDKRPLSWARQLTVSLGWALFILLIAALLVYLTIFLLKAKRTYSRKFWTFF